MGFSLLKPSKKIVSPSEVAAYYDEWTDRYMAAGGSIIEAFRPECDDELLDYYIASCDLKDGQRILDAGCGVGGPALHFAEHLRVQIEGLTISKVQVQKCASAAAKCNLLGSFTARLGDYHEISKLYGAESFDRVLFLESLGHAAHPDRVLKGVFEVLAPGGMLYIKDFFVRESNDPLLAKRIAAVVERINYFYSYNTLDLHDVLSALRKIGFQLYGLRKPGFLDSTAVREKFESQNQIDIFGGLAPFVPTDWLEIVCLKPTT